LDASPLSLQWPMAKAEQGCPMRDSPAIHGQV